MSRHLNSQRKADRSLPSTRAFPQETVNELERGWSKKPENVDRSFSRTGECIDDTKEGKRMEGFLAEFSLSTLFFTRCLTTTGGRGDLACKNKRGE